MHTITVVLAAIAATVLLATVGWLTARRIVVLVNRWVYLPRGMKIHLAVGDITTAQADVIVNAAKTTLLGGGGVDGAIHRAGGPAILRECKALRADLYPHGLPVGRAVATTAGDLPASWVVHTVGPDRRIGQKDPQLLRAAYANSLIASDALGAKTVAFPLISSGVYGWPIHDAYLQALIALRSVPTDNVKDVYLYFYDQEAFQAATGGRAELS